MLLGCLISNIAKTNSEDKSVRKIFSVSSQDECLTAGCDVNERKKFKLVRHKEILLFSFLHIVYFFLSNNKSFIIGFFSSELTNSLPMVTVSLSLAAFLRCSYCRPRPET